MIPRAPIGPPNSKCGFVGVTARGFGVDLDDVRFWGERFVDDDDA